MNEDRQLQRQCERQAALTATPDARKALDEMAAEYRRLTEYVERRGGTEQQVRDYQISPAKALSVGVGG